jgi:hypothetical protein
LKKKGERAQNSRLGGVKKVGEEVGFVGGVVEALSDVLCLLCRERERGWLGRHLLEGARSGQSEEDEEERVIDDARSASIYYQKKVRGDRMREPIQRRGLKSGMRVWEKKKEGGRSLDDD